MTTKMVRTAGATRQTLTGASGKRYDVHRRVAFEAEDEDVQSLGELGCRLFGPAPEPEPSAEETPAEETPTETPEKPADPVEPQQPADQTPETPAEGGEGESDPPEAVPTG